MGKRKNKIMEKVLPDKLTKKMLFEIYRPLPKKTIRLHINYFIKEIGGNERTRIISDWAKLNFFLQHGIPTGYKLSDNLQKKMNRLNDIRSDKC